MDVTIDTRKFTAALKDIQESQLPFATMKAMNESAIKGQDAERLRMQSEFTIRRPWVLQGVKINRGDFATKRKLEVRVSVDADRDFLNKFEFGTPKTPRDGKAIAVPIEARRNKATLVADSAKPRAFEFREVGGKGLIKASKGLKARTRRAVLGGHVRVFEGKQRTIMIRSADGSGVILQRFGGRKGHTAYLHQGQVHPQGVLIGQRDPGLRVLYRLKPRVKTPKDLHFAETVTSAFLAHFPDAFTRAYAAAVATAKP